MTTQWSEDYVIALSEMLIGFDGFSYDSVTWSIRECAIASTKRAIRNTIITVYDCLECSGHFEAVHRPNGMIEWRCTGCGSRWPK